MLHYNRLKINEILKCILLCHTILWWCMMFCIQDIIDIAFLKYNNNINGAKKHNYNTIISKIHKIVLFIIIEMCH